MKKDILKIQIIGTIFAIVVGSLLYFTYELSGNNIFVSWFSAVNESTWEHLKLAFWGIYFFGIFEYFHYGKNNKYFFLAKAKGLYLAPIFIVIFFYGYKSITGEHSLPVDIAIFIVSIILSKVVGYYILIGKIKVKINPLIPLIFIDLLTLLFIIFTYVPPRMTLFRDSTSGEYGIGWQTSSREVSSFDECVARGNPIMESYPRRCSHKGDVFTELIIPIYDPALEDIQKLFMEKYPKYADTLKVSINKEVPGFVRGGISFEPGQPGGGFMAYKKGGVWQIAWEGNGGITRELKEFGFPDDMLEDCAS